MIGCYDFCGHYEWTFAWLERAGGPELLRDYWREAIALDSQRHAAELIQREGIEGMKKYWGHTLVEESPSLGFTITAAADRFRIDMHDCPSKGFLIRNGLEQHTDYCDHCMGWVGPMMRDAGYVVDHEHNHCGQCWWEYRAPSSPPAAAVAGANDVRLRADWLQPGARLDRYEGATSPDEKRL
jgi:hypothetical protein